MIPKPCLPVRLSARTSRKEISLASSISVQTPTFVIDTSMDRSSRVMQHGNPKFWIFFPKSLKFNFYLYFYLCRWAEITLASSISIHQWKGLHEYHSMETQKFDSLKKIKWILTNVLKGCEINNSEKNSLPYSVLCVSILFFVQIVYGTDCRSMLMLCYWKHCLRVLLSLLMGTFWIDIRNHIQFSLSIETFCPTCHAYTFYGIILSY